MLDKIKTPRYIIELARKMRVALTPSEQILWDEIKEKKLDGYKFRRQHPVYRYILDFYCHEKRLAIEIDGDSHKVRKDYDEYRDAFIQASGIETLRFSNDAVVHDVALVVRRIKERLSSQ